MLIELLAFSSNTNTLLIALAIPILGVIGPLLMAWQINGNARQQKLLDWEREDEVAARAAEVAEKAAEAAELLIKRQITLDEKTDEVAKLVSASSTGVNTQLEKIHGLVNSQLTHAVRSELEATMDTLALMGELIDSRRKAGVEPTVEILATYEGRRKKIKELEETVRVREEADAASKLVNTGPNEVVIVNPDPVPVIDTKIEDKE